MMHLTHPKLPRFQFDWEPTTRKLYVIDITLPPNERIGEPFDDVCESPEMAERLVKMWCSGYMAKEYEAAIHCVPRHYRMSADGIILGASVGPR